MQTLKEARAYQYDYHRKRFPYLDDWKKNPYTFLKARFYMETAALLVFLLSRTKIKPNTVTLVYALCGILGGVLLAIPSTLTITAAVVIFFSKGTLDWADGSLARTTGRTSVTGAVLDPWGALMNSLAFQAGLGLYAAQKSQHDIYFYLTAALLLMRAADLRTRTFHHFGGELIKGAACRSTAARSTPPVPQSEYEGFSRPKRFIIHFLDDRARTVDLICLLLLVELFVPGFFVTGFFVWGFALKYTVVFAAGIYLAVAKNWIEKTSEHYVYVQSGDSSDPKDGSDSAR